MRPDTGLADEQQYVGEMMGNWGGRKQEEG